MPYNCVFQHCFYSRCRVCFRYVIAFTLYIFKPLTHCNLALPTSAKIGRLLGVYGEVNAVITPLAELTFEIIQLC
jgi:hypothetical protein